jgi:hypothetical protein
VRASGSSYRALSNDPVAMRFSRHPPPHEHPAPMTIFEDRRHRDNGQGRVKDPSQDGRLKANRERGVSLGSKERPAETESTGKGRVKDPERDGRLKRNRLGA